MEHKQCDVRMNHFIACAQGKSPIKAKMGEQNAFVYDEKVGPKCTCNCSHTLGAILRSASRDWGALTACAALSQKQDVQYCAKAGNGRAKACQPHGQRLH